ncbi:glycoside hydrolase family 18 protein [Dysgonomonas sp. BGC7]|uniref:glycoside hydrolase family 18 protein n=1 Tax=Dysgonomonas sp. BGC7 TaxID=1658008 RepID=UPI000681365E|nr:glycoside hydrolase family 18 protein [Dysgonomonas sp. BGC7]MBD8387175.1 glycoside hydrolase family 18 protein [Dysgonomonas sp. BGC7]
MKYLKTTTLIIILYFAFACTSNKTAGNVINRNEEKIVLAYVTSWSSIIPDPNYITHINYAFGHVNNTFDGVRIDNENRLRQLVELKIQKPSLKIILSIGGWGSGRFSEMAADEHFRRSFAKDCKRVIDEFALDGIDIDWEYPTTDMAGISSSPADKDNFTLMMKYIREEIGENKLLTLATVANARYIDFRGIGSYINFVNIMSYDMGSPPFHHSGLYRSKHTGGTSVDEAVKAHVNMGVSLNKLVMGIPFYGRGKKEIGNFSNYRNIIALNGYTTKWDDEAKAPYLSSDSVPFVCGYDDARSISIKCKYIKEHGMLGAMYWDYAGDDDEGTLRKAVYNGLNL